MSVIDMMLYGKKSNINSRLQTPSPVLFLKSFILHVIYSI
jgi:7,8-dihydro-6-hydroxymethylpterin-pyrophosphokinase